MLRLPPIAKFNITYNFKVRHIASSNIIRITILSFFIFLQLSANAQVNSFAIDSSKFKRQLLPILDTVYKDDQSYRMRVGELMKNKATKEEIDSAKGIMHKKDSLNLIKVNKIISDYGWLGPQDVGMDGSQALFLVIQHSDLTTQQKYLPLIIKAEKEGKTFSSNLAILEDRIAVREGRKQLYGSQGFKDKITGINYPYPIADVDNLDKNRRSMGMPPMKEYSPTWNLDEYKLKLPELERIVKEQNVH